MKARFAAVAVALAFTGLGTAPLFSGEAAAPTVTPAATAVSDAPLSPSAQAPEAFAAGAEALDAQLGVLDGGVLTQALRGLARKGAPLRLLLDPAQRGTRREGQALAQLSPSAQVRWLEGAGQPLRRLLSPVGQLVWRAGEDAARADGGLAKARERFEHAWAAAKKRLPESQRLEDELRGLPDPREGVPHLSRRRDAVDRSAPGDAEPEPEAEQSPQPTAAPTPREGEAVDLAPATPTAEVKTEEKAQEDAEHPRP
jgi:hypothetical protein